MARPLTLGTGAGAEVRLEATDEEPQISARLHRRGNTYELIAEPGATVWVNGEPVDDLVLASGDVLEIGERGALLRFRAYPPGSPAWKTMSEAFSDCLDCSRQASPSGIGRVVAFVTGAPREMATQTMPAFRVLMALTMILLATTVVLSVNSLRLRRELRSEAERISGIAELLERSEREAMRREDLAVIQSELGGELEETTRRLEALEVRSEASARVIREASRSVVFLQGAFGFTDGDGRELRFLSAGPPIGPEPPVGFEGDGPLVESLYTGTAFVVSDDGLLMTNRHVALPWEYEAPAQALIRRGLKPVMRRFVGYLPTSQNPFAVELVKASEDADVALLRTVGAARLAPPLELGSILPAAGDEVIVLGYPTGMRALLARTDSGFVASLTAAPAIDFWSVAERLAEAGLIGALASRGIVSQVSAAAVVYDAETTQGGSGGPVLALDGAVVAVNAAIIPEFGGSNLGVPAAEGMKILLQTDPTSTTELSPPR